MRRILSTGLVLVLVAVLVAACGGAQEEVPEEAEIARRFVIQADVVAGPRNIPEAERAGRVCVLQSRFPRNSEVVWRARVIDPVSGEELDDSTLESVEVRLGDGQTFAMRYGPHPRENPTDFFWTTAFDVPEDYPSGTLNYEIVATGPGGETATFTPFNVAPSLLTVTDEVLEQIEEEEA